MHVFNQFSEKYNVQQPCKSGKHYPPSFKKGHCQSHPWYTHTHGMVSWRKQAKWLNSENKGKLRKIKGDGISASTCPTEKYDPSVCTRISRQSHFWTYNRKFPVSSGTNSAKGGQFVQFVKIVLNCIDPFSKFLLNPLRSFKFLLFPRHYSSMRTLYYQIR